MGWNVLTDYSTAKDLIIDGILKDDIFIRFIYSNKNEDKQGTYESKTNKMQKKVTYIEKTVNPPEPTKRYSMV